MYRRDADWKQKRDANRKRVVLGDSIWRKPSPRSLQTWTVLGCSRKSERSFKKRSKLASKILLGLSSSVFSCGNAMYLWCLYLKCIQLTDHTNCSIKAYPIYCMTNCTGSIFLSGCSSSWQLRFTGTFKIKRRSTSSTTASQSPMLPGDSIWDLPLGTSLLFRGFKKNIRPSDLCCWGSDWNSLLYDLRDPSLCSISFRRGLKTVLLWDTNVFSTTEMLHDIVLPVYKFNIDIDIDIDIIFSDIRCITNITNISF